MLSFQTVEPHTLELLSFYHQKYPEHSDFVALRSMTYFEDAEQYGMPKMFVPFDWEELKRIIIKKVADFVK